MKLITLDFETYYDRQFSLTKFTTEEYIRSPMFETIGVATQINNEEPIWVPKHEVADHLAGIDWSDAMVVCQNTAFDGAIMSWRYGIKPMAWADTLGMSRALFPHEKSHSLAKQAERMRLGQEGRRGAERAG
jgi:DNA polymerase III alpha subunit (gram-positive type)